MSDVTLAWVGPNDQVPQWLLVIIGVAVCAAVGCAIAGCILGLFFESDAAGIVLMTAAIIVTVLVLSALVVALPWFFGAGGGL